jgi:DNA polymerase III epsilon subunit-like protein
MKLCFIDIETTGTDPLRHCPIQVSGEIEDEAGATVRFGVTMQPLPNAAVDPGALVVNGLEMRDIQSYPKPADAKRILEAVFEKQVKKFDKLDKMLFIAYNARFDYDFLREWWKRQGDVYFGSWFWFPPIDVMNLAMAKILNDRPKLPDFKQATVAKFLGLEINEEALHDANYDMQLMKRLYYKLTGRE